MFVYAGNVGDIVVSNEIKYTCTKAGIAGVAEWSETKIPNIVVDILSELSPATKEKLGGIIVGDNLKIESSGRLSAIIDSFSLAIATATTLGGIKVGSNLNITSEGILSGLDPTPAYVLPKATDGSLGGIILGDNLSMDSSGKVSAKDTVYSLPAATDSILGGVKVAKDTGITNSSGALGLDLSVPLSKLSAKDAAEFTDSLSVIGSELSSLTLQKIYSLFGSSGKFTEQGKVLFNGGTGNYTNVLVGRELNTMYVNSTGRPIIVVITLNMTTSSWVSLRTASLGDILTYDLSNMAMTGLTKLPLMGIIPAGESYGVYVDNTSSVSLRTWVGG